MLTGCVCACLSPIISITRNLPFGCCAMLIGACRWPPLLINVMSAVRRKAVTAKVRAWGGGRLEAAIWGADSDARKQTFSTPVAVLDTNSSNRAAADLAETIVLSYSRLSRTRTACCRIAR